MASPEYGAHERLHEEPCTGITRREFVRRALALGIAAPASAALLQEFGDPPVTRAAQSAPVLDRFGSQRSLVQAVNSLPGIDIVPRVAWSAPDKELSPQWVPFYQPPFHIVVHHTGEAPGPHGPIADVQSTWRYQALDLGWGDLGYNYIIDTAGTIYEGRAGGPDTVGAHTLRFNQGGIGIAAIGNYDIEEPAPAMLHSLQALIVALANRYGIDVLGTATDNGVRFDTVAGHRDFLPTDCPGAHLYALLPSLRKAMADQVRTAAQPLGPATLYLHSGTPQIVLVHVRNMGTTTWNGRYALTVSAPAFLGLPAQYNLPETPPGEIATVPLFLPALSNQLTVPMHWVLLDASRRQVGVSFTLTIQTLLPGAAIPSSPPLQLDRVEPATAAAPTAAEPGGSASAPFVPSAGGSSVSPLPATTVPGTASPLPGASATWYFAVGSCNKFDTETISLLNPGTAPAYVVSTLVRADADPVTLVAQVPPSSQTVLSVGFAAGRGTVLGVIVQSTEPLVAERTIYHASPGTEGTSGSMAPGYSAPQSTWYLPQLPLAADQTGVIDVLNPTVAPATIAVDVVTGSLLRRFTQLTLPAVSTVRIALPTPVASAAIRVLSPGGSAGVIAEALSVYDHSQGATLVGGLPALSVKGYLPGFSGGPHTYVTAFNPGPATSQMLLIGLDADGNAVAQVRLTVPPGTQTPLDLAQGTMRQSAVVSVQATQPVAFSYLGLLGPSGETSLAADYRGSAVTTLTQPAQTIAFAAGGTRHLASEPHEWLLLFNPQPTALRVSITVLAAKGPGLLEVVLGPRASSFVSLDGIDVGGTHGLLVQCEQAIVAWHGIDSNEQAIRLLSAGVPG